MADSFNEDDDLRRLKQWWSENGLALVLGAVVGLGGIGGWQWWQAHTNARAMQASGVYNQLRANLGQGKADDATLALAQRLKDDFSGTPYATQAALLLARADVEREDYNAAIKQLEWVTSYADQDAMRSIARVRQARLLWAQDHADKALDLLQQKHPAAFTSLYAELEGDIQAEAGKPEAARAAYSKALQSLSPEGDRTALERKLQDVGGAGIETARNGETS